MSRAIQDLFDFSELNAVVTGLSDNRTSTFDVFEVSEAHKESYFAAKEELECLIVQSKHSYQLQKDMKEIQKIICPKLDYDIDICLRWFLRYLHSCFMSDTDLDFNLDRAREGKFSFHFKKHLSRKINGTDEYVAESLFQLTRILSSKSIFKTLGSKKPLEDCNMTSHKQFAYPSNKLINFMGLFCPNSKTISNLEGIHLTFTYDQLYDLISTNCLDAIDIINVSGKRDSEASIATDLNSALNVLLSIIEMNYDKISHRAQISKNTRIGRSIYSVIPDTIVTCTKDGKRKVIPFECKKGDMTYYFRNFKVRSPLSPQSYCFTHLYSELVRDAVVCNVACGFIFCNDRMLFIIFEGIDFDSQVSYWGKELATPIKNRIIEVNNYFDLLKCIICALELRPTNFKRSVIENSFVEAGIITKVMPMFYARLQQAFNKIRDIISPLPEISQIRGSEVDSKINHPRRLVGSLAQVGMTKHQLKMILKIASNFGSRWKIINFEQLKTEYDFIEVKQDRIYLNNSTIFKVKNKMLEQGETLIKIIDPLFSKYSESKQTNIVASFKNGIKQFSKESYAYWLLRETDFVPTVISIGIITNNNNEYQDIVDIENPSVSGFFFEINLIEGESYDKSKHNHSYSEKLQNNINAMHILNIAHCDLTMTNLIVSEQDNQVYIIDYGSSSYRRIRKTQHVDVTNWKTFQNKMLKDRNDFKDITGIDFMATEDLQVGTAETDDESYDIDEDEDELLSGDSDADPADIDNTIDDSKNTEKSLTPVVNTSQLLESERGVSSSQAANSSELEAQLIQNNRKRRRTK